MAIALEEARRAWAEGEVPVGAVVVSQGEIVARAHNRTIHACDPTAHAEILALRKAARKIGAARLPQAEVWVTLEPCAMCVGAMIQARVRRLVFGCRDPKSGAVVSLYQLASDRRLNHRIPFEEGEGAEESARLLRQFFRERRGAGSKDPG
jgi:tRNA(adenine34) deaminase